MDFIGLLPPEISLKILSHLDMQDILNCCLVSKAWYNVTNCNSIWKYFWNPNNPLKESEGCADFDWTFSIPCKWKLYRMNHYRVINNWREDRYKRYEINGRWLDTTAYDGRTLVVNNGPLDVYRIENGNLVHIQTLRYKKHDAYMCSTNSSFIAVKYKPFVVIYRCENDKYKISHYLYNRGRNTKLYCTKDPKEIDSLTDDYFTYPYWSNLMCILSDTLYVYLPHLKVMYAWEMKEMKCLLEKEADINDVSYDKHFVYLCIRNSIFVFDKDGNMVMRLETKWNIGKMHCNHNMILAQHGLNDEVEFCAWDKTTGNLIFHKKMNVSEDIILHPKRDVILDMVDKWQVEKKEITAYNLMNDSILWKSRVSEYSLLGDLHSIVAERFLLFCTYTRHIFDIYDTETGRYLYSLNHIDDDDLYASYDLLIYSCNKNAKLILHIYS